MRKAATNFIVDRFYGGKVLKAVAKASLSNATIDRVREFMSENSKFFDKGEEQKLIYTEIHKSYCSLMENILEEPLRASNVTIDKFLTICANLRDESDGNVQTFIDLVLTVNDYQIFADLMINPEKQEYYFFILKSWARHADTSKDEEEPAMKK